MKQQENNKMALTNEIMDTDVMPDLMDIELDMKKENQELADDFFQQAICSYEQKNYDLALEQYTKVIELKPNSTDIHSNSAYFNRGLCFYENGNHELAIADFSRTIELKLGGNNTYYCRGVCYYEQGNYEGALDDFSKAIELNPYHDEALHNRGLCYLKQGDYDCALVDCTKVIELVPDEAKSYFGRGFCYYEHKNYELAIIDFSKAIELAPDVTDAYQYRGRCYDKQQNYKLALIDLNKVNELSVGDTDGYQNIGAHHRSFRHVEEVFGKEASESRHKKIDPALVDCNKAIELAPDNATAYYDRGQYYLEQKNYQLALIDYTKAIELQPDFYNAYDGRACCHYEQKNYKLALADFFKVTELKPETGFGYYGQGLCYYKQDDYELALGNYTKAIELRPDLYIPYHARANCYKEPKKHELALTDLSKVIKLAPDEDTLVEGYSARAKYYREQENYELAIVDFTKAIELSGAAAAGIVYNNYEYRGFCYFYLGNFKRALLDFTEALGWLPDHVEFDAYYLYNQIAICYYEQKQYDLSIIEIDNAIKFCKTLEDKKYYCFQAKIIACSAKQYNKARAYIEQAFDGMDSKEQNHKNIYLQEIDKQEELEEKNKQLEQEIAEKEAAHKALHEKEKEMLSFFTHTMRNALSTAPESLRQAIRLLGSEDYETDKKHYKAINKIAALFSTLSLTDCLIDTFKQSISEPEEFQRAWINDNSGDATPKWVIASALRQSLNRIIFMSDTSELRQLLNNADTPAIIATRKSFIENILPLNLDSQGIASFYSWLKQIDTLEISIAENSSLHFGVNQVKFSLLFAITSELLLNALKYWDGTGKIQVSWQLEQDYFIFRVTNPCLANASSNLAGTHKGLAFIKRLIELLGEQARFTPIAEEDSFTAKFKLHHSLLEDKV